MPQFRKKPVVIEARQTGREYDEDCEIMAWCDGRPTEWGDDEEPKYLFCIETLEGIHHVSIGDWVIKGVEGEFYPCKPNIFLATYEAVTDAGKAS